MDCRLVFQNPGQENMNLGNQGNPSSAIVENHLIKKCSASWSWFFFLSSVVSTCCHSPLPIHAPQLPGHSCLIEWCPEHWRGLGRAALLLHLSSLHALPVGGLEGLKESLLAIKVANHHEYYVCLLCGSYVLRWETDARV